MVANKSATEILDEAAPLIEKGRAKNRENQAAATGAIAILERRARSATHDVALPGGDAVPIRSRLPRTEMQTCVRLFEEIGKAHAAGDKAASEAASNALIGHILYMEDMTPDEIGAWLNDHPESFSDLDAAEILIAFGRMIVDEKNRQERVANFRPE
jgi:hypothetical protein